MHCYTKNIIDKLYARRVDNVQLRWFGYIKQISNKRLEKIVYNIELQSEMEKTFQI